MSSLLPIHLDSLGVLAAALRAGGVVIFPTETVYGIAALATHTAAIERLYALKGRAQDVPLQLLVRDAADAQNYVDFTNTAHQLAQAFWPGGLTMVLPKRKDSQLSPALNRRDATLGVRAPYHPDLQWLLAMLDAPLAASSANLSGQPAAQNAQQAAQYFTGQDIPILDGGTVTGGVASTVIDLTQKPYAILREGAVPRKKLDESIQSIKDHYLLR